MIRAANHQDLPKLLLLAAEMHTESRYAALPFSAGKVTRLIANLIDSPCCFLRVVCSGNEIVGFMAAFLTEHFCSDAKVAGDYGLFISKEHRGGIKAARLLTAYRDWATSQGAALIHAGITTGVTMEATANLYRSLGHKQVGVVFQLGAK